MQTLGPITSFCVTEEEKSNLQRPLIMQKSTLRIMIIKPYGVPSTPFLLLCAALERPCPVSIDWTVAAVGCFLLYWLFHLRIVVFPLTVLGIMLFQSEWLFGRKVCKERYKVQRALSKGRSASRPRRRSHCRRTQSSRVGRFHLYYECNWLIWNKSVFWWWCVEVVSSTWFRRWVLSDGKHAGKENRREAWKRSAKHSPTMPSSSMTGWSWDAATQDWPKGKKRLVSKPQEKA